MTKPGDSADSISQKDNPSHFEEKTSVHFSRFEIDTIRGLALIAVVWHHAVIWFSAAIEKFALEETFIASAAELPATLLTPIRMPLFTILSGLVYALRPVNISVSRIFMAGKIRRILLPLFFLSTLQYFQIYFLRDEIPKIDFMGLKLEIMPEEFWTMWFFHFGHLWFLQALFVIFIMMMVIDLFGWMDNYKSWIFWLLVFAVMPYIFQGNSFWSSNKTILLSIYFFFGVGLFRFKNLLFQKNIIRSAWILFLFSMAIYLLMKADFFDLSHGEARPLLYLAGTTGSMCILSLRFKAAWLAWLGGYSYTVYLYHGVAFESHLLFDGLLYWGLPGRSCWFALQVSCGLLIPILIDRLFSNVHILRTPMLGKKAFT